MSWSQETLKTFISDLESSLGRTPTLRDLNSISGGPKEGVFRRHFGTWNAALSASGLKGARRHKWTRRELIDVLITESEAIGRSPSSNHFRKSKRLPSPSIYIKYFGSWNKAMNAAGLPLVAIHEFKSRKKLLDGVNILYRKLRRPPRSSDIDQCEFLPSYGVFGRHFGNIQNLYKAAGIPIDQREIWFQWEKTCERVARALYGDISTQNRELFDGRPDIYVPKMNLVIDAMTRPYRSKRKISAISRFGGKSRNVEFWCIFRGKEIKNGLAKYVYIEELIERLVKNRNHYWSKRLTNFELVRVEFYTKAQIITAIRRMAKERGRKPFGKDFMNTNGRYPSYTVILEHFTSFNRVLEAAGYRGRRNGGIPKYSKTELIRKLVKLSIELKRTPKCQDLLGAENIPNAGIYKRYFGSFNNALRLAHLQINSRHYEEDEILIQIRKLAKKLKRTPSLKEFNECKTCVGKTTISNRYGNWSLALNAAGLNPPNYKKYDDIVLLQHLIRIGSILQRRPRIRDLSRFDWSPSGKAFTSHFGSFTLALSAAGLKV